MASTASRAGVQKENEGRGEPLLKHGSNACCHALSTTADYTLELKKEETILKTVSRQVFVTAMGKVTGVQPIHRAGPKVTGFRKQWEAKESLANLNFT